MQGVQDATTSEDLVVLSRASQLLELGKDESAGNDFIFNQLGLNRTDLEQLYIYLLRWARIESSTQLIERFRRLFIDTSEETEPMIRSILSKISNPRFPIEEFNAIFNRCCYIVLNRWAMRASRQQAIPEFLNLLESAFPEAGQPENKRRLNSRVQQFTQTEQFTMLRSFQNIELLTLFSSVATIDLRKPLGELIQRYPYLYDNYLIDRDYDNTVQQIEEIVRRVKIRKQQLFEAELAQYVTNRVQPSHNSELVLQTARNPTLLTEQDLVISLKQFSGNVEGSYTEKDLAERLMTHSRQHSSLLNFKSDLYQYLTSSIKSEYGKHSFYNRLWDELKRTSPQSDSQRINESLLIDICKRLLNFLVIRNDRGDHYNFVDLFNNVGSTALVSLLLKIVLLCHRARPYLEQRFFILFNHYRSHMQGTMQWLIECLENLLVALTTNFSSVDFSLVKLL